ncbi:MAG TPA: tetratricopeptide repeat protein [Streptosporangiaceae bacterium]|nr:tetratricopeptide repeat protein [Streptosporangiaceae bacterium]
MPWLERIRAENENLRGALQRAFGPDGDAQLGARMAALLWHPWDLAGARAEGLHWIDAGLQATGASEPERRMRLLAAATLLRLGLGEINTARGLATEQLGLARAQATAEQALAAARLVGEDTALGFALDILGSVLHQRGRSDQAGELVEEALTHYRAIGYREGEASALQATGRLLLDRGAPDAARQAFGSALELCLRLGHRGGIAASLEGLAQAFLASGEDAQAAVFCGAAAAQCDLLGALARTTQRRALEEIRSRLLASLGADQLQRATRRGAESAVEDLLKPQCPTAGPERSIAAQGLRQVQ